MGADSGIQGTPEGLAVDGQGRVYVTDYSLGRVEVFSSEGELLGVWGNKGGGDGEFLAPVAIALDGPGNIYVSDQTANTIQKFTLR
jgi:sugar lactone lactonase YvrE